MLRPPDYPGSWPIRARGRRVAPRQPHLPLW